MIELRVYASLLSRRAQTFLLTVQSVPNCRGNRLLEKLPKAEFSLRRAFKKRDYKNILVESGKTFGPYELKVDRNIDETDDSVWTHKRVWTIEETSLRIDGNLVFLCFIRRRSDWIVKTPRESQSVYRSLRHLRHVNTPQKRHDTSKRDGNHRWEKITNGFCTKIFDAETEVTRGFHVEEETRRSDKIVGRTKNKNAFISPEKPSYTCHNHHERQHEHYREHDDHHERLNYYGNWVPDEILKRYMGQRVLTLTGCEDLRGNRWIGPICQIKELTENAEFGASPKFFGLLITVERLYLWNERNDSIVETSESD